MEKPNVSVSLTLLEMTWQISLEVDAESTDTLTERPSISVTVTIMGFFVLVACYGAQRRNDCGHNSFGSSTSKKV